MDFSPEYVELARQLRDRLRVIEIHHEWQVGEYGFCPDDPETGGGAFVYAAEDHMHHDDLWLPRLDQLAEMVETQGFLEVAYQRAPTEYVVVTQRPHQLATTGETLEAAFLKLYLATR